jgi:hypothetical protein
MFVNKKCVKMTLRATDLPSTVSTNAYGSTNSLGKLNITFTNVNMKQILGAMYDEYDLFNIQLVMFGQVNYNASSGTNAGGTSNYIGSGTADRNITIKMTGLPFISQLNDMRSPNGTTGANIAVCTLTANAATLFNSSQSNFCMTFRKPREFVDITFDITSLATATAPTLATVSGTTVITNDYNMFYTFNIYGVELERRDKFDDARARQMLKI